MSASSILFLADGRFPAGGHAHSLATEPAIEHGIVSDQESLRGFLLSRLGTTGLTDATFCAHASAQGRSSDIEILDVEYEARTLSPKTRKISRQLGRQLIETAAGVWPDVVNKNRLCVHSENIGRTPMMCCTIDAQGWHHPVAFGLVANVLGIDPLEAATAMLYQFATTITTAVVRLLGLDPVTALRLVADQPLDDLAARAISTLDMKASELPSVSNPLIDILSEDHDRWDMKLFAS